MSLLLAAFCTAAAVFFALVGLTAAPRNDNPEKPGRTVRLKRARWDGRRLASR
jgi:hypothetical protein